VLLPLGAASQLEIKWCRMDSLGVYHGRLEHWMVLVSEVVTLGDNNISSLGNTVELVLVIG
jgi:hypothetical protein